MSIASTLTRALNQAGLSQKQLALRTGVTQSYISQICSGKKIPTISTLTRIGDCLGLTVQDFLGDVSANNAATGEMPPPQKRMHMIPSRDEEDLLRLYRTMNKRDQGVLRSIAENFSSSQKAQPSRRFKRRTYA